jgi:predicted RNA binding protein YcfA (HicA-like mRNA interferase family)
MYTYHPKNTCVHKELKVEAFIAGFTELYDTVVANPDLRMIPIVHVDQIRHQLKQLGYRTRIRYRGPHAQQRDTHKADARAFTVYFKTDL